MRGVAPCPRVFSPQVLVYRASKTTSALFPQFQPALGEVDALQQYCGSEALETSSSTFVKRGPADRSRGAFYPLTRENPSKSQQQRSARRKYGCPHCDVTCSNQGQLRGHIRVHTGERPYHCPFQNCTRSFARNEELTRHKRIHTGQRPFACRVCGQAFGRKDHLSKHQRTHATLSPWQESYGCSLVGSSPTEGTSGHSTPPSR